MTVSGNLLIGARSYLGTNGVIKAVNPATGETLEPAFGGATSVGRGAIARFLRPGT